MTTPPPQLPEGALIERAQGRHTPRLSNRKAAELAGISEGRWRHIVKGYQTVQAGMHARVVAPAETLARMAHAAGATPAELRAANRSDAAEAYERLLGLGEHSPPIEIHPLADDPAWREFELLVQGTPPTMRAAALRIATAAVEAAKAELTHSNGPTDEPQ
ncbi:hypothetical protein B4N89_02525 [Embleya scabrispora]|uniref:Uncharacterized protein n=1 Tax=Embleya scabrispora TaxID=159449 RepID=A0A1T3NTG1_9ACTN|nr:helix-turn-helix domain-containing protein [Embleya scabrispora]OPC79972.1 hypothetical protein B4N89_02525 [Embleya scabrispora]